MKFADQNPLAREIIGYMQSYPPKPIYGDSSAGIVGEMGDQANIMEWLRSIGGKLQQKYKENQQWEKDYQKRPGFYDGEPDELRLRRLEKLYPELRNNNEVSIAPSTVGQDIAMMQEINHTLNPLTGKLEPNPW
tara:strand:- start:4680 stop:5081 length:402 start_codon:yes stop_codon:yes gene_type:complete